MEPQEPPLNLPLDRGFVKPRTQSNACKKNMKEILVIAPTVQLLLLLLIYLDSSTIDSSAKISAITVEKELNSCITAHQSSITEARISITLILLSVCAWVNLPCLSEETEKQL